MYWQIVGGNYNSYCLVADTSGGDVSSGTLMLIERCTSKEHMLLAMDGNSRVKLNTTTHKHDHCIELEKDNSFSFSDCGKITDPGIRLP